MTTWRAAWRDTTAARAGEHHRRPRRRTPRRPRHRGRRRSAAWRIATGLAGHSYQEMLSDDD